LTKATPPTTAMMIPITGTSSAYTIYSEWQRRSLPYLRVNMTQEPL
jgi:hypothetical protein